MTRKVEPEQIWQIIYSISSNHKCSLKLINISSCTSVGYPLGLSFLDVYEKIYLRSEATAYEKQKLLWLAYQSRTIFIRNGAATGI